MLPALDDDSPSLVTVTEGPSTEAWASIKGVFVELYVLQGKRLAEIRQMLGDQDGFYAT